MACTELCHIPGEALAAWESRASSARFREYEPVLVTAYSGLETTQFYCVMKTLTKAYVRSREILATAEFDGEAKFRGNVFMMPTSSQH